MFIKLMKAVYFKPTVLLMAIAMLTMSFTMPGEVVTLKAGTTIPLELVSTLSSNNVQSGQMVDFRVLNDIKVNGKLLLQSVLLHKVRLQELKKEVYGFRRRTNSNH